jgi:hypothetical protein
MDKGQIAIGIIFLVVGVFAGGLITWIVAARYYLQSTLDLQEMENRMNHASAAQVYDVFQRAQQVLAAKGNLEIQTMPDGSVRYRYQANPVPLIVGGSAPAHLNPSGGGMFLEGGPPHE